VISIVFVHPVGCFKTPYRNVQFTIRYRNSMWGLEGWRGWWRSVMGNVSRRVMPNCLSLAVSYSV